jgi:hypothetical protein
MPCAEVVTKRISVNTVQASCKRLSAITNDNMPRRRGQSQEHNGDQREVGVTGIEERKKAKPAYQTPLSKVREINYYKRKSYPEPKIRCNLVVEH